MKNLRWSFCLLFLFTIQAGYAQQKQGIPAVSFFVAGDYFSPKFTNVDAVFQTIERNYSLPAGTNFKDYYDVLTGIRFAPVPQHSVQLEFGGSFFRSSSTGSVGDNRSASYIQMYYSGGTYSYNIPVNSMNFFIGGGLGYIWLSAQRSYAVQPGVAEAKAGLTQLHGLVGAEYVTPSDVSIGLEVGYSYATTLFPQRSDVDFSINGVTAGLKLGVPIVKVF